MDTLNFNTFANSPQQLSGYPSQIYTQQSFSPKKSKNSRKSLAKHQKQSSNPSTSQKYSRYQTKVYNLNDTEVSLLKSNISMLSSGQNQINFGMKILELQLSVTEQVLALREDKLTLMQEYNIIMDRKYKLERQIAKVQKKRKRESSDINQIEVFDNKNTSSSKKKEEKHESVIKNELLKQEYASLAQKKALFQNSPKNEQQQRVLLQIQNFSENSRIIQQKLNKIQENLRTQQQRFETFFPERQIDGEGTSLHQRLYALRVEKLNLYRMIASRALPAERSYLYNLIQQHQQLHDKIARIIEDQNGYISIQEMNEKIRSQEDQKARFLEDLRLFKQEANRIKRQNEQMRQKIEKYC